MLVEETINNPFCCLIIFRRVQNVLSILDATKICGMKYIPEMTS